MKGKFSKAFGKANQGESPKSDDYLFHFMTVSDMLEVINMGWVKKCYGESGISPAS